MKRVRLVLNFLLITWIIIFFPSIMEAKIVLLKVDKAYFDALGDQNPFAPRLPQEKTAAPPSPKDVMRMPPSVSQRQPTPVRAQPPRPPEVLPAQPKPTGPPKTLPPLTVSGVVWNTQRPQAIINGQVVDIGDVVSGAKIMAIRPAEIKVLFQEEEFTVKP